MSRESWLRFVYEGSYVGMIKRKVEEERAEQGFEGKARIVL